MNIWEIEKKLNEMFRNVRQWSEKTEIVERNETTTGFWSLSILA